MLLYNYNSVSAGMQAVMSESAAPPGAHYEHTDILGRGTYGAVYLAKLSDEAASRTMLPQQIAIKVRPLNISEKEIKEEKLRIEKLAELSHPNLVLPLWYELREKSKLELRRFEIFMEYCVGGDLEALVRDGMCFTELIDYTRQMVMGLEYLHGHKIAHIDLKPQNVLLTGKHPLGVYLTLKICDVDNPVVLRGSCTGTSEAIGPSSRRYCSPEWTVKSLDPDNKIKVGRKSDIWSLGIMVHDMAYSADICAKIFISRDAKLSCVKNNGNKRRATKHSRACPLLLAFIARCLQPDSKDRPQAGELTCDLLLVKGPFLLDLADHDMPLWRCELCSNRNPEVDRPLNRQGSCPRGLCEINIDRFGNGRRFPIDQQCHIKVGSVESYNILCSYVPLYRLEEITLQFLPSTEQFSRLLTSCPRLKSVRLKTVRPIAFIWSVGSVTHLDILYIKSIKLKEPGFLSRTRIPHLKVLTIGLNRLVFPETMEDETLDGMPNLEELNIFGASDNSFHLKSSSLERFTYKRGSLGVPKSGLASCKFPILRVLSLDSMFDIVVTTIQAKAMPLLERFTLTWFAWSFESSVLYLEAGSVTQWRNLRYFTLDLGYDSYPPETEAKDELSYSWLRKYLGESHIDYERESVQAAYCTKSQYYDGICDQLEGILREYVRDPNYLL